MPKKFANLIWKKAKIQDFFAPGNIEQLAFTFQTNTSGPKKLTVAGFDHNWKQISTQNINKRTGSSDVSLDNDFLGSVYILNASEIPPDIQRGSFDLDFTPKAYRDPTGTILPFVDWEIRDPRKPLVVLTSINPKPPAQ